MSRLESDFHAFKAEVHGDIVEVKLVSNQMKCDLEQVKSRITKVEERKTDDASATRVNDIEKAIGELKLAPAPGNRDQPTALVGGPESALSPMRQSLGSKKPWARHKSKA